MSDDEDDYVAFGKPLRELSEKDIIRKKPIAVEEQIGELSAVSCQLSSVSCHLSAASCQLSAVSVICHLCACVPVSSQFSAAICHLSAVCLEL